MNKSEYADLLSRVVSLSQELNRARRELEELEASPAPELPPVIESFEDYVKFRDEHDAHRSAIHNARFRVGDLEFKLAAMVQAWRRSLPANTWFRIPDSDIYVRLVQISPQARTESDFRFDIVEGRPEQENTDE